jgi:hypothetical protein
MLASQPERRMRAVRAGMLVAWFVLIASLVYDPLTPLLTQATNLRKPFRIGLAHATVQGVELPSAPYAMGSRIFWTMILPLIPVLLMLFGHETWRRVCPLSHFSQIPRMLGWQRQTPRLNRRTGAVERSLALLPNQAWIRRNHLAFQFGFLVCGVMGRILFYNSDRAALICIFAFVLAFALLVGLLYGGKTWCNYFCPIGVVQEIYTGPGGLFDSKAINAPTPITQSMCRQPGPAGDKSICVGCTSNCSDVDVEHSYWKTLDSQAKLLVYAGYFGMVFAFYTYYYAYSGGWSYYFSGAWTHEAGQLGQLLSPGFYIAGRAIPIPKFIAVPVYFAACILGSFCIFRAAEWCYARFNARRAKPLSKAQIRHRTMTVAAFLSFNLFYVFAGRPNLLLLPGWAIRLVDAALVVISTTWLWRSLGRDADMYRRESLAKSLRDQLRRMGFRSEELLEGRSLASLSADEVYVLAKTLPGFSTGQRREAYRAILAEVLETGETRSAESLELLADLRSQLGLSDTDHAAITEALGIADPLLLDPNQARSVETRIRVNNYRDYLYGVLESGVSAGITPRKLLASEKVVAASAPFRTLYGISEDDHEKIVAEITDDGSKFAESAKKMVAAICGMESQRFSLASDLRPEAQLVRHALLLRQLRLLRDTINLIALIEDSKIARSLAQSVHALMDREVVSALSDAAAGMPEATFRAFLEPTSDRAAFSYLDVVIHHQSADEVLHQMAGDQDPLVAALSASALPAFPVSDIAAAGSQSAWLIEEIVTGAREHRRSGKVETLALLLSIDAFSRLELGALAEIARLSHRVTFHPGETICRYGDVSDRMFVLVAGETRTWIETDGRQVTLGTGRPGAVFGELGVITGRPRSASVDASGDSPATVVAIPREVIEQLLSHDLTAARGILEVVSGYLLNTLAAAQHPAPEPAGVSG